MSEASKTLAVFIAVVGIIILILLLVPRRLVYSGYSSPVIYRSVPSQQVVRYIPRSTSSSTVIRESYQYTPPVITHYPGTSTVYQYQND